MTPTLRARLLVSHLAVSLVGIAALVGVGFVVGGSLLNRQGRMNGGQGMRSDDARDVVGSLLPTVLIAGGVAALVAAGVAALLVTRSIMGPLAAIRLASRRIARGEYDHKVPAPRDAELAEVARDIDALAARLAETEARRSHLIDEVAHEMRTPVTTIAGTMEALLDQVIDPGPEVYALVASEASRLGRLAEDLSTLSRAEEHTLVLARERIDLAALARGVAARLGTQFEHVSIDVTPINQEVAVVADADRVAQVLVNLIGNALRHSDEGAIVQVDVDRDEYVASVRVTDHGVGLDADDLDRVFERFYRVPATGGTSGTARGGRGIGLTIARSLARAHGGDVEARSEGLGKGSTFTLTLPV
jgi:signal transduction histidine kinase